MLLRQFRLTTTTRLVGVGHEPVLNHHPNTAAEIERLDALIKRYEKSLRRNDSFYIYLSETHPEILKAASEFADRSNDIGDMVKRAG